MLTTNKAVYGTDGSLTDLGKLKGGRNSGVIINPEADNITHISVNEVDGDMASITVPKNTNIYITAWLDYDEGGLKVAHVRYNKTGSGAGYSTGDENSEHLIIGYEHDTDDTYDIYFYGDSSHELIYYELTYFKERE